MHRAVIWSMEWSTVQIQDSSSKSRMLSIFNLSTLRYSIQNPPYLMDFLDLKS